MNHRSRNQWANYFRRQISRRRALGYFASAATAFLVPACYGNRKNEGNAIGQTNSSSCLEINSETAGPFVADGSNGPNVLSSPEVFRRDIRANLDGSNIQPGIALKVKITVLDSAANCAPLAGAAVYIWHCNAESQYSAYNSRGQNDQTGETFLRGVQVSDAQGQVTFDTVYPGRYIGRAIHIHARIYRDDSFTEELKTTQFAFEDSLNDIVYESSEIYEQSLRNPETVNAEDYEFSDGVAEQLLDISGDSTSGYVSSIIVHVAT